MAVGINNGILTLGTPLAIAQGGRGVGATYYFCAYKSSTTSNVTGDGTEYTVIFDTEINDTGSWYDNATGIATAPVTGFYLFGGNIDLTSIGGSHTTGTAKIVTTNHSVYGEYGNPNAIAAGGSVVFPAGMGVYLSANDTIKMTTYAAGGGKTVGVYGDGNPAHPTYFWGALISV